MKKFLLILVFIFEHFPFLKQLPHFSSCRVFETYPGFETITRIQINVNFHVFQNLWFKFFSFFELKNVILCVRGSVNFTILSDVCHFCNFNYTIQHNYTIFATFEKGKNVPNLHQSNTYSMKTLLTVALTDSILIFKVSTWFRESSQDMGLRKLNFGSSYKFQN